MGYVLAQIINLYVLVIFARIILSWFPVQPGGPVASISSVVYSLTEPVLAPVRRVVPQLGMFDISTIVVIFGLRLLASIVANSF